MRGSTVGDGSMRTLRSLAVVAAILAGFQAAHADDESCKTVRLADPGWTDIAATNAVASIILKGLGYEPRLKQLSVPKSFAALKAGQADAFLGNWMPSQTTELAPFAA